MERTKKRHHLDFAKIIFILFFIIIIVVLILLLRGSTTNTSGSVDEDRSASLICESDTIKHRKITSYGSYRRVFTTIKAIFSQDTLSRISLDYTLTYDTDKEAVGASSHVQADLWGKAFPGSGYRGVSSQFSNKFTHNEDNLIVSLIANASEINESAAPYFMIDTSYDMPYTLNEYKTNFEQQGFICNAKE